MTNIRLADAERMILRRIPDLAGKITAGDIDEADVIQVESDAVIQILKNPDGCTSETYGTYSYRDELGRSVGQARHLRRGMADARC